MRNSSASLPEVVEPFKLNCIFLGIVGFPLTSTLLFLDIALTYLYIHVLDGICTKKDSARINDNHPSAANDWSDAERWNSTTIDAFCPPNEMGIQGIQCSDDKGEPLGRIIHAKFFTASCNLTNGLMCTRTSQTTGKCPDYSVTYTCRCPPTTTLRSTPANVVSGGVTSHTGRRGTSTVTDRSTGHAHKAYSTAVVGQSSFRPGKVTLASDSTQSWRDTRSRSSSNSLGRNTAYSMTDRSIRDDGNLSAELIAGIASGGAIFIVTLFGVLVCYIYNNKNKSKTKIHTLGV